MQVWSEEWLSKRRGQLSESNWNRWLDWQFKSTVPSHPQRTLIHSLFLKQDEKHDDLPDYAQRATWEATVCQLLQQLAPRQQILDARDLTDTNDSCQLWQLGVCGFLVSGELPWLEAQLDGSVDACHELPEELASKLLALYAREYHKDDSNWLEFWSGGSGWWQILRHHGLLKDHDMDWHPPAMMDQDAFKRVQLLIFQELGVPEWLLKYQERDQVVSCFIYTCSVIVEARKRIAQQLRQKYYEQVQLMLSKLTRMLTDGLEQRQQVDGRIDDVVELVRRNETTGELSLIVQDYESIVGKLDFREMSLQVLLAVGRSCAIYLPQQGDQTAAIQELRERFKLVESDLQNLLKSIETRIQDLTYVQLVPQTLSVVMGQLQQFHTRITTNPPMDLDEDDDSPVQMILDTYLFEADVEAILDPRIVTDFIKAQVVQKREQAMTLLHDVKTIWATIKRTFMQKNYTILTLFEADALMEWIVRKKSQIQQIPPATATTFKDILMYVYDVPMLEAAAQKFREQTFRLSSTKRGDKSVAEIQERRAEIDKALQELTDLTRLRSTDYTRYAKANMFKVQIRKLWQSFNTLQLNIGALSYSKNDVENQRLTQIESDIQMFIEGLQKFRSSHDEMWSRRDGKEGYILYELDTCPETIERLISDKKAHFHETKMMQDLHERVHAQQSVMVASLNELLIENAKPPLDMVTMESIQTYLSPYHALRKRCTLEFDDFTELQRNLGNLMGDAGSGFSTNSQDILSTWRKTLNELHQQTDNEIRKMEDRLDEAKQVLELVDASSEIEQKICALTASLQQTPEKLQEDDIKTFSEQFTLCQSSLFEWKQKKQEFVVAQLQTAEDRLDQLLKRALDFFSRLNGDAALSKQKEYMQECAHAWQNKFDVIFKRIAQNKVEVPENATAEELKESNEKVQKTLEELQMLAAAAYKDLQKLLENFESSLELKLEFSGILNDCNMKMSELRAAFAECRNEASRQFAYREALMNVDSLRKNIEELKMQVTQEFSTLDSYVLVVSGSDEIINKAQEKSNVYLAQLDELTNTVNQTVTWLNQLIGCDEISTSRSVRSFMTRDSTSASVFGSKALISVNRLQLHDPDHIKKIKLIGAELVDSQNFMMDVCEAYHDSIREAIAQRDALLNCGKITQLLSEMMKSVMVFTVDMNDIDSKLELTEKSLRAANEDIVKYQNVLKNFEAGRIDTSWQPPKKYEETISHLAQIFQTARKAADRAQQVLASFLEQLVLYRKKLSVTDRFLSLKDRMGNFLSEVQKCDIEKAAETENEDHLLTWTNSFELFSQEWLSIGADLHQVEVPDAKNIYQQLDQNLKDLLPSIQQKQNEFRVKHATFICLKSQNVLDKHVKQHRALEPVNLFENEKYLDEKEPAVVLNEFSHQISRYQTEYEQLKLMYENYLPLFTKLSGLEPNILNSSAPTLQHVLGTHSALSQYISETQEKLNKFNENHENARHVLPEYILLRNISEATFRIRREYSTETFVEFHSSGRISVRDIVLLSESVSDLESRLQKLSDNSEKLVSISPKFANLLTTAKDAIRNLIETKERCGMLGDLHGKYVKISSSIVQFLLAVADNMIGKLFDISTTDSPDEIAPIISTFSKEILALDDQYLEWKNVADETQIENEVVKSECRALTFLYPQIQRTAQMACSCMTFQQCMFELRSILAKGASEFTSSDVQAKLLATTVAESLDVQIPHEARQAYLAMQPFQLLTGAKARFFDSPRFYSETIQLRRMVETNLQCVRVTIDGHFLPGISLLKSVEEIQARIVQIFANNEFDTIKLEISNVEAEIVPIKESIKQWSERLSSLKLRFNDYDLQLFADQERDMGIQMNEVDSCLKECVSTRNDLTAFFDLECQIRLFLETSKDFIMKLSFDRDMITNISVFRQSFILEHDKLFMQLVELADVVSLKPKWILESLFVNQILSQNVLNLKNSLETDKNGVLTVLECVTEITSWLVEQSASLGAFEKLVQDFRSSMYLVLDESIASEYDLFAKASNDNQKKYDEWIPKSQQASLTCSILSELANLAHVSLTDSFKVLQEAKSLSLLKKRLVECETMIKTLETDCAVLRNEFTMAKPVSLLESTNNSTNRPLDLSRSILNDGLSDEQSMGLKSDLEKENERLNLFKARVEKAQAIAVDLDRFSSDIFPNDVMRGRRKEDILQQLLELQAFCGSKTIELEQQKMISKFMLEVNEFSVQMKDTISSFNKLNFAASFFDFLAPETKDHHDQASLLSGHQSKLDLSRYIKTDLHHLDDRIDKLKSVYSQLQNKAADLIEILQQSSDENRENVVSDSVKAFLETIARNNQRNMTMLITVSHQTWALGRQFQCECILSDYCLQLNLFEEWLDSKSQCVVSLIERIAMAQHRAPDEQELDIFDAEMKLVTEEVRDNADIEEIIEQQQRALDKMNLYISDVLKDEMNAYAEDRLRTLMSLPNLHHLMSFDITKAAEEVNSRTDCAQEKWNILLKHVEKLENNFLQLTLLHQAEIHLREFERSLNSLLRRISAINFFAPESTIRNFGSKDEIHASWMKYLGELSLTIEPSLPKPYSKQQLLTDARKLQNLKDEFMMIKLEIETIFKGDELLIINETPFFTTNFRILQNLCQIAQEQLKWREDSHRYRLEFYEFLEKLKEFSGNLRHLRFRLNLIEKDVKEFPANDLKDNRESVIHLRELFSNHLQAVSEMKAEFINQHKPELDLLNEKRLFYEGLDCVFSPEISAYFLEIAYSPYDSFRKDLLMAFPAAEGCYNLTCLLVSSENILSRVSEVDTQLQALRKEITPSVTRIQEQLKIHPSFEDFPVIIQDMHEKYASFDHRALEMQSTQIRAIVDLVHEEFAWRHRSLENRYPLVGPIAKQVYEKYLEIQKSAKEIRHIIPHHRDLQLFYVHSELALKWLEQYIKQIASFKPHHHSETDASVELQNQLNDQRSWLAQMRSNIEKFHVFFSTTQDVAHSTLDRLELYYNNSSPQFAKLLFEQLEMKFDQSIETIKDRMTKAVDQLSFHEKNTEKRLAIIDFLLKEKALNAQLKELEVYATKCFGRAEAISNRAPSVFSKTIEDEVENLKKDVTGLLAQIRSLEGSFTNITAYNRNFAIADVIQRRQRRLPVDSLFIPEEEFLHNSAAVVASYIKTLSTIKTRATGVQRFLESALNINQVKFELKQQEDARQTAILSDEIQEKARICDTIVNQIESDGQNLSQKFLKLLTATEQAINLLPKTLRIGNSSTGSSVDSLDPPADDKETKNIDHGCLSEIEYYKLIESGNQKLGKLRTQYDILVGKLDLLAAQQLPAESTSKNRCDIDKALSNCRISRLRAQKTLFRYQHILGQLKVKGYTRFVDVPKLAQEKFVKYEIERTRPPDENNPKEAPVLPDKKRFISKSLPGLSM